MELQLERWLVQVEGGDEVLHEKEQEMFRNESEAGAEIRQKIA